MYPASSQSTSRPDERRRNPRHRSSSLIYVQLGSDNGGIVTNLGVDGVAFQAARKLTEENNTTLDVRLRGSGLNASLVGQLVWLGASKKEAGICFKEIPSEVHQGITDWIVRETQASAASPSAERVRPKLVPAVTSAPASPERPVSLPLSTALAMSRESSVVEASPVAAVEETHVSAVPVPSDALAVISSSLTPPEAVSPIEQTGLSSDRSENDLLIRPSDTGISSAQDRVKSPPLPSRALFDAPQIEYTDESKTLKLYPLVTYKAAKHISHADVPQGFQEVKEESKPATVEVLKKEVQKEVGKEENPPHGPITKQAVDLVISTSLDKWVPPAMLAIWRRGNRRQRWALAGMAFGCVWILGLILVLGLIHIASPSSASAGGGAVQQTQVRPEVSAANQAALNQDAQVAATEETEDGQPPPPPPSWFSKLGDYIFDIKPVKPLELWRRPKINIDPSLVGVQVWTSKDSGYYYCTDSPFYMTLQPGSIMNQRDALQSGYQPILGQFCN